MSAVGKRHGSGGEFAGFDQPAFLARFDALVRMAAQIGQRDEFIGAGDSETTGGKFDVHHSRFKQFGRQLLCGIQHFIYRQHDGRTADAERAGAAIAFAPGDQVGVAAIPFHVLDGDAEPVCHDLGHGGFQPLPNRHGTRSQRQRAVGFQPQCGKIFGWTQERPASDFDTIAQTDAAQFAAQLRFGAAGGKRIEFG